jgi:hypothetical protein
MGMKLDAPVATNALDSSGEILSIKGLDITDFLEGRAVANWEHSNTSEDGAVGRFIYAKKIFSAQDCENERQLSFWKQLGHEFLYGVVELFDEEGHPGATAIAAMARYFLKRKEKIRIGMSIEGSTLDRDGHLLNRAVARKAAITLTPCNKECWIEYAGDEMPVSKSESVEVVDFEIDSYENLLEEIAKMDRLIAPKGVSHPHSYDWHDDESLVKDDKGNLSTYVHSEAHGPTVNEQAGNVSDESFNNVMSNYGQVKGRSQPSNLKFYKDLDQSKDKVNSLVQNHGFTPYYAGGKFGKPDLANKNYSNKHLMIYDPTSGSGGDFGHEDYTDAWRKTHELAHGLTHEAVNKIYGEGRRLGKLGIRSPREMKRALHWEWLAAHKQRDLMGQLGHKISDEDFHKELNTIMGDSTHRSITGKFTEPSEMGFEPHSHKIPLEHSLNAIDEHAKKIGLQHEDDTLVGKSELTKNDVAPSMLTGQSALAREHIVGRTERNTLKAVLRDWDKKKPLKDMIKAAMPQLTDTFVDHFTQAAQEMIKKSEVLDPQNIVPFSPIISDEQQQLIAGLAFDDKTNPFEINAAGQKVILRKENNGGKQAAYSFLMSRYFGLGEFFPLTNHFTYQGKTGEVEFTAELIVENSIIQPKEQFHTSIGQMKMDGTLYKLQLADLILGKFSPRSNMSLLFAEGQPICTYTNDIFEYALDKLRPMDSITSDIIPLDVIGWLESKSSNQLKLQMSLLGLSRNQINEAIRVKSIIEMNRHQTLGNIFEMIAGADFLS